ncbi:hypothetical protein ACTJJ7_16375 [Phyllobacterium sp. 22229]|uniref:hypothetical protein n=1 Tax=Phyllobacterium sp. 22229 TaxID=3453895 RepID=UPI003F82745F
MTVPITDAQITTIERNLEGSEQVFVTKETVRALIARVRLERANITKRGLRLIDEGRISGAISPSFEKLKKDAGLRIAYEFASSVTEAMEELIVSHFGGSWVE